MQHQCEDRAVSQVIADRCEKLLDFTLADISRQAVTLVDIMSLGDNWISDPLFTLGSVY
jgi:hypothetical protein